jgi:hypothetical protein
MKKFLAVISATAFLAGYLAMREEQAQYGSLLGIGLFDGYRFCFSH